MRVEPQQLGHAVIETVSSRAYEVLAPPLTPTPRAGKALLARGALSPAPEALSAPQPGTERPGMGARAVQGLVVVVAHVVGAS